MDKYIQCEPGNNDSKEMILLLPEIQNFAAGCNLMSCAFLGERFNPLQGIQLAYSNLHRQGECG